MDSAKTLFQLQSELVDRKVDISVNNAIDKVVLQIQSLQEEVQTLRIEMNQKFHELEVRLTAVETKLGMVNENDRRIRDHFVDYSFKFAWISVGIVITYLFSQFHMILR